MTWATQGHELRTLVDMNVLGSCEQSPFEVMNCSSLWLTWMTPSRELRVLDAMNSSEFWMKWMSWDLVYSGLLILWTTQGCAYCHPEAYSAPSGYSINSWAPHSYAIRAHRAITGPSFRRADYALWGADYRRGRGTSPEHSGLCSRAILFTSSSCHYMIISIVSFMYFLTIVALVIPCFWYFIYWDWLYYFFSFILYFHEVIQIYQFFSTLSIILF